MHTYRQRGQQGWSVQFENEPPLKYFDDESAAVAFLNFLNGGSGDVAVAKRLLRQAANVEVRS